MMINMVELGSIAEFRNGVNYNKNNFGNGIKVINVADFKNHFKPKYEELGEINPEGVVNNDSLLKKNDIIFVRSNGNKELIGRTLFIDEAEEDIIYSAFCIRCRFIDQEIDPKFYAYLFKTNFIRSTLTSQGNGTNISNLNQGILSKLKVPKPPKVVQKKIVDFLSKYDELIENNERRIKLLEESTELIYKEWFVNFKFLGNEKVSESKYCTWKERVLGEFFPIITGKKNANVSCKNGKYKFFTCSQETLLTNEYSFNSKAILLAGNGEFNIKYYEGKFEAYQRTYVLVPYNEQYFYYLYEFLKYNLRMITNGSKGSVIKYLTKDMIAAFKILEPTPEVINSYNQLVTPIYRQIETLNIQNEKLKEARDILIPKLIAGEIEV